MNEILNKISSYNIFNYLVPGGLFYYLCRSLNLLPEIKDNTTYLLLIFYGIGLILSRISSLFLEPTLRFFHVIAPIDYGKFLASVKLDPKIDTLVEVNNMYRTLSTGFLIISISVFIRGKFGSIISQNYINLSVLLLIASILFILSVRKQSIYIKKRINESNGS